jgi:hypothetical protein
MCGTEIFGRKYRPFRHTCTVLHGVTSQKMCHFYPNLKNQNFDVPTPKPKPKRKSNSNVSFEKNKIIHTCMHAQEYRRMAMSGQKYTVTDVPGSSPNRTNHTMQGFPNSFAREALLASKITTDPRILAHINTEGACDRYPKLKSYISELILDSYEHTPVAYVTMHCMIGP